ncbi:MAG: O-antigen ligase family protein [Elusimicrobia bacterium]|nr:O-antigen ligase family protein [Candidatus Liberimonas magnetica]
MNKITDKVLKILNYLFALSMPFTHVIGYITGGVAFLFSWDQWKRLRHEKLFFWLKILMIYGLIRSFFSEEPNIGYMAMLGYLTQWMFPFVLGYTLPDFSSFRKSFWTYYITFTILVFLSILAFFGLFPKIIFTDFEFAKEGLLKGGRSHIALAALCLLASFLSLGHYLHNSGLKMPVKNFFIFLLLFFLGSIFLTGSRGYYAAALITYLILGAVYGIRSWAINSKLKVITVTTVLVITALYFLSPTIRARISRTNYNDGSVQERLSLYKVALWEIKASPVFGYGPGQGIRQELFYKMLPDNAQTPVLRHHPHLHSFYLNFAAEFGLLGMLVLFFVFYSWLKEVWKMYLLSDGFYKAVAFGLFWGIIGIMFGDCLDTLLRGPGVAMELFWLTGLIMGQRNFTL